MYCSVKLSSGCDDTVVRNYTTLISRQLFQRNKHIVINVFNMKEFEVILTVDTKNNVKKIF